VLDRTRRESRGTRFSTPVTALQEVVAVLLGDLSGDGVVHLLRDPHPASLRNDSDISVSLLWNSSLAGSTWGGSACSTGWRRTPLLRGAPTWRSRSSSSRRREVDALAVATGREHDACPGHRENLAGVEIATHDAAVPTVLDDHVEHLGTRLELHARHCRISARSSNSFLLYQGLMPQCDGRAALPAVPRCSTWSSRTGRTPASCVAISTPRGPSRWPGTRSCSRPVARQRVLPLDEREELERERHVARREEGAFFAKTRATRRSTPRASRRATSSRASSR